MKDIVVEIDNVYRDVRLLHNRHSYTCVEDYSHEYLVETVIEIIHIDEFHK